MRALILDQGHDRAALVAARALGSDGWEVASGVPVRNGLASQSRSVSHTYHIPSEAADTTTLLQATNRAIAEGRHDVVFSCDDATICRLSAVRDQLDTVFPYADHGTVMRSFDKLELMREAQRCGVAVPRTAPLGERELESFGSGPLVVKPRFTFLEGVDGHLRATVTQTLAEARERSGEITQSGGEPILQEHVEGHLMAFIAVTDRDARIVARVQQIADRTWPVGVGVSARAHTVAIDSDLDKQVQVLLASLGWFGLAQLQFILAKDGIPRLLDFNGRFYGSLALAVSAGPNLPAIWARLATGLPVGHVPTAQPGKRYQWLAGDLRASRQSTSGMKSLLAVFDSLVNIPRSTHSVLRAGDPRPAISHFSSKLKAWMLPDS
jgi:predicted ATP-grasp superfamily ATP-dependent carboligase